MLDLRARYAAPEPGEHSLCTFPASIDLPRFRGEGHFLSQFNYGETQAKYLMMACHVEASDDWNLLYELTEDGEFVACTIDVFSDLRVGRDLLDSILEIRFLSRALSFSRSSSLRVLDIGAGYGRFAHRLTTALPQAHVTCTDAVPESTFLCDFYLAFRGCQSHTRVIPFDQLDQLQEMRFDLAVIIHSWSECTLEAIKKCLSALRRLNVPRLLSCLMRSDSYRVNATATGSRSFRKSRRMVID